MTPGAVEGGRSKAGAHLQCGVHNLVHGGEVRIPQELGLLLESQHTLRMDAAHGGGDLCHRGRGELVSHLSVPQPPGRAALPLPPPCHPKGPLSATALLQLCPLLSLEQDLAQDPRGLWV